MMLNSTAMKDNVPTIFYEAKKLVSKLGLKVRKIDCCINGCMLFYGNEFDTQDGLLEELVNFSVGQGDIFPSGKNIAVSKKDISGVEVVKLWVDKKPNYNHFANTCRGGECRHYIQVVWSKSVELGCAKVTCDNGGTLVACIYQPPAISGSKSPY
ncbi:pathogenesis-related protein 1-like [Vicia villosa]|uniref:pathogenesis-related protein 1-like n=1 Tax=Vicia villosa TaxID=3911 RepID=UPI00273ADD5C|nr:pathogenesis-related protein 1-like [Vicia villosa]